MFQCETKKVRFICVLFSRSRGLILRLFFEDDCSFLEASIDEDSAYTYSLQFVLADDCQRHQAFIDHRSKELDLLICRNDVIFWEMLIKILSKI